MNVATNGITLAYDDTGTGLPLVLIHGFPLCRSMWRPQAEALSRSGCRVIAPDLRGFGESTLGAGVADMNTYADDIVALMDYLRLDRWVAGGMSMGGYVLLNLLERYPDRIAAAIFITTRAGGDDDAAKFRRTALAEACLTDGIAAVAEAFRNLLFSQETLTERRELVDEVTGWMRGTDPRGAAAGLIAMRDRKDYLGQLGSITQQALVIGADLDQAAPMEHSRLIAERLPDAEFCILHGAGHMVNLEQPEGFNQTILEFLAHL